MVDVQTEILIDHPLAKVAAYAMDPANAPEWYVNIKSIEWETEPGVVGLGTRAAFVASFLGKRLAYTYEIREFIEPTEDPNYAKLVMGTTQGPFPMETSYEFEAVGEKTRMKLRNRGEPSGFAKVGAFFMKTAMRKANEKDLQSIKAILER